MLVKQIATTLWAIATEMAPASEESFRLTLIAEELLQELAWFLKVILEAIAILTVGIAMFIAFQKLLRYRQRERVRYVQESIRLELGLALALSLEFQLAADIVGTVVSPNWDAIAKLAAITGIRTFLNFFLQKEVQELQQHHDVHPVDLAQDSTNDRAND